MGVQVLASEPRVAARGHVLGIVLLLGAVTCFACLDASAKWVNRGGDPLLTAAIRYLGSFLLVGVVLNPVRHPTVMRTRSPWLQCARALCLLIATVCSFFAAHLLPLTQATAISFTSPLIVAVIAGPLLGEWIGARRVVAVIAGFAGVLVITHPGSGAGNGLFQPAVLLALLTAVVNAFYSITTRLLAGRDPSATTLFYTAMVGAILLLPVVPLAWVWPASPLIWLLLAALGVFATLGHWLLILAHKHAPASLLAPFFYGQLLVTACLGLVVFGEVPDRWTVLGGCIVMGSGLYLLGRERVRRVPPSAGIAP
jgi:drug/metabolite transporter (DMT)-like permease